MDLNKWSMLKIVRYQIMKYYFLYCIAVVRGDVLSGGSGENTREIVYIFCGYELRIFCHKFGDFFVSQL